MKCVKYLNPSLYKVPISPNPTVSLETPPLTHTYLNPSLCKVPTGPNPIVSPETLPFTTKFLNPSLHKVPTGPNPQYLLAHLLFVICNSIRNSISFHSPQKRLNKISYGQNSSLHQSKTLCKNVVMF